jgi:hypothetical protein
VDTLKDLKLTLPPPIPAADVELYKKQLSGVSGQ